MENEEIIGLIITIIMGFGWGSFATMATYRIPLGMPWIGDKPRCFKCKHELFLIDYLSIISYFLWKGRCRYCGDEYECSFSYFFTEAAITAFFVMCYLKYGFGDLFVLMTLMIVGGVILTVVDAENKKIPSKILISLLLIGAVYRVFVDGTFYGGLYGGITGLVLGLFIRHIYYLVKGEAKKGFDYTVWQHEDRFIGPAFDYVKLLGVVGVFLPLVHLVSYIAIVGAVTLLWRLVNKTSLRIGSIMAMALIVSVIYPETLNYVTGY